MMSELGISSTSVAGLGIVAHAPRRIARADLAGEITASIICPSLIYGVGTGPDKIVSSLIPDSVRRGLRFGRVPVGGKGTNVWSDVSDKKAVDGMS